MLVERWLRAQEQGAPDAFLGCYAGTAVLREFGPDGKYIDRRGAELRGEVAARLRAPVSIEAGAVDTTLTDTASFMLLRRLPTRAEQVGVNLTLQWKDGALQIVHESDRIQATLTAPELAALPRLKGADWLNKARLDGARHELQLWLQRPPAPQWGKAVPRYVAAGPLTCTEQDVADGCVSSSWSYKPPSEGAGPADGCLRRHVLRWGIARMPAADLRAAMPALAPLVRGGALGDDADLAVDLLHAAPVGDWDTVRPLLQVLVGQAAEEADNRMTELDHHLEALTEAQLRTLVGRRLTYGAVADALGEQKALSPEGCAALLEALRTVPRRDRLPRIRAAQRLGRCPAGAVTAGLREVAQKERDRHVRWAAALALQRLGDGSLLPAGPPQTDKEVLDQACLAGVEEDAARRRERLQALLLPESLFIEWIEDEDEVMNGGSVDLKARTRRSKRALTLKDLEEAVEFRRKPVPSQHPNGYRELHREEGRMGAPESWDFAPGKGKDGGRGILRALHREDHTGGSC